MRSFRAFVKRHIALKMLLLTLLRWTTEFGLDARKFVYSVSALLSVMRDYRIIRRQNKENVFNWKMEFIYPRLHDRCEGAGIAQPQYFYQDYLIARKIFIKSPL